MTTTPYLQGKQARRDGFKEHDNPYDRAKDWGNWDRWDDGWLDEDWAQSRASRGWSGGC